MNHFDMASSTISKQDMLGAQSIQQITSQNALLAAILGGSPHTRSMPDACYGIVPGFLGDGGLPSASFLGATGQGGFDPLQNMWASSSGSIGQPPLISSSFAGANILDLQRVQAIRQQARALTEGNPFTVRSFGQPPAVISPVMQMSSDSTLKALGSAMRKKDSPYLDASSLAGPHPTDLARRRTRGGVTEPFPEKLHRMLQEVEEAGDVGIVSFFAHGRAFGVHDPERFVSEVMPKYFKQSRLSSFQRQLNLYGFTRIISGPDIGGYYHELFLQGRPSLCVHMRRVGVPQGEDRRKVRSGVKKTEPDFYSMAPVIPCKTS
jgi:hypothetical protein